jgi:hypothetical protein
MHEAFDDFLRERKYPGLDELRQAVHEQLGSDHDVAALMVQRLAARVYRLVHRTDQGTRSLVVKCLDPPIAHRNLLVATRWLPAVGLSQSGPPLLATAADRSGRAVWHIYEDLGDATLAATEPILSEVEAVVTCVADVHARFAGHVLLPECRLHGGDFGTYFFQSNTQDAVNGIASVRSLGLALSTDRRELLERLSDRLQSAVAFQSVTALDHEARWSPYVWETMLHGDLWTSNTLVFPDETGIRVRLIDWDHAAVGPVTYDLSTFLYRFPAHHRTWILALYRDALTEFGRTIPPTAELNAYFTIAEYSRLANRLIWPTIAIFEGLVDWGFEELARIEDWFGLLEPVLPDGEG